MVESGGVDHVSRALDRRRRDETGGDGATTAAMVSGDRREADLLESMEYFDTTPYDELEAMWRAFREGMPMVFLRAYGSWTRRDGGGIGNDALALEVFRPAVVFSRLCREVPCPESINSNSVVFDFLREKMRAGARIPAECVFTEAHSAWELRTNDETEYFNLLSARARVLKYLNDHDLAKFTAKHMYLAMKNLDVTGVKFLHEVIRLPLDDANADEHYGRAIRAKHIEAFEFFFLHHLGGSARTFESLKACFFENVPLALQDVRQGEADWARDIALLICSIEDDLMESKKHLRALCDLVDSHKTDIPEGTYVGVMNFLQTSYNDLDANNATKLQARYRTFQEECESILGFRIAPNVHGLNYLVLQYDRPWGPGPERP